jgi:hypothetical protein
MKHWEFSIYLDNSYLGVSSTTDILWSIFEQWLCIITFGIFRLYLVMFTIYQLVQDFAGPSTLGSCNAVS